MDENYILIFQPCRRVTLDWLVIWWWSLLTSFLIFQGQNTFFFSSMVASLVSKQRDEPSTYNKSLNFVNDLSLVYSHWSIKLLCICVPACWLLLWTHSKQIQSYICYNDRAQFLNRNFIFSKPKNPSKKNSQTALRESLYFLTLILIWPFLGRITMPILRKLSIHVLWSLPNDLIVLIFSIRDIWWYQGSATRLTNLSI